MQGRPAMAAARSHSPSAADQEEGRASCYLDGAGLDRLETARAGP